MDGRQRLVLERRSGKKGALVPGQLADLAVLSADYFSVPEEEIKRLESVLTLVGGKPVYAAAEFARARAAAAARHAAMVAGREVRRLRHRIVYLRV